jgi:hypothetical protein
MPNSVKSFSKAKRTRKSKRKVNLKSKSSSKSKTKRKPKRKSSSKRKPKRKPKRKVVRKSKRKPKPKVQSSKSESKPKVQSSKSESKPKVHSSKSESKPKRKSSSGLKGIKLKKGELEGYKLSDSTITRRRTLGIQVYNKGYLPVMKRVNVISILLRNKSPKLSKNAESDKNWLMKRNKTEGSASKWIPRRADGDSFFK